MIDTEEAEPCRLYTTVLRLYQSVVQKNNRAKPSGVQTKKKKNTNTRSEQNHLRPRLGCMHISGGGTREIQHKANICCFLTFLGDLLSCLLN